MYSLPPSLTPPTGSVDALNGNPVSFLIPVCCFISYVNEFMGVLEASGDTTASAGSKPDRQGGDRDKFWDSVAVRCCVLLPVASDVRETCEDAALSPLRN